jgi:hypothetical protein
MMVSFRQDEQGAAALFWIDRQRKELRPYAVADSRQEIG